MRINNIEKLLSGTEKFLFDELARPAAEKDPISKLDIGIYHKVLYMKAFAYPRKAAQETQAHRCSFRRKSGRAGEKRQENIICM